MDEQSFEHVISARMSDDSWGQISYTSLLKKKDQISRDTLCLCCKFFEFMILTINFNISSQDLPLFSSLTCQETEFCWIWTHKKLLSVRLLQTK